MSASDHFKRLKNKGKIALKSQFLSNLSKVERYEFLQLCHRRKYKKDEFIYHQGDPGTGMYFIEKGRVQLITETNNKEHTHSLKSPDSFGAFSISYEFRRFASARCLTDCTLLGFFKPDLETLKKRQPTIAVKFVDTIAILAMRQLGIAIDRLKETLSEDAIPLQFDAYYENP